jgi:MFS family permease
MIITTAIPQITNDFNSVTDIDWYGSAYQLTTCAFQLLFGKIYSFYSIKATFLISVFLFEAGSAVSGAAPNSDAFIIGRAIAGIGGAGILSGMVSQALAHLLLRLLCQVSIRIMRLTYILL